MLEVEFARVCSRQFDLCNIYVIIKQKKGKVLIIEYSQVHEDNLEERKYQRRIDHSDMEFQMIQELLLS